MKILLTCVELDRIGRGICYNNNKTYFIYNLLPGEVGLCTITKEKEFYEGYCKTSDIQELSKSRSRYSWTSQTDLAHLNFDEQLKFIFTLTCNTFKKFKLFPNKIKDTITNHIDKEYRNKVTFFADKKNYLEFGSYGLKSHILNDTFNITVPSVILDFINSFNQLLKQNQIKDNNLDKLIIRCNYDKQLMLVFEAKSLSISPAILSYLQAKNNVISIYVLSAKRQKLLFGKEYLRDKIGNYNFFLGPTSFFQINSTFTSLMYDQINNYLNSNDSVLDLYSGIGSIISCASSKIKCGLGLEINSEAVKLGQYALTENNLCNIMIEQFDCNNEIKKDLSIYNTIIVDPPRAGLSKNTIQLLVVNNFEKIIYLSCYLPTLCRDLKLLEAKYEIVEVTPLMNFPQTSACETLVLLKKKGSAN